MIYSIYPSADATIYEASSSTVVGITNPSIMNTGLDAILDVAKEFDTNSTASNSRILIKFDITTISASVASGIITNPKYYLDLFTTEVDEIPVNYTLYAYPISQSWNMGTGRYGDSPQTENGVSWKYRLNSTQTDSAWATASFAANTTGSHNTTPGGGNWYTNYVASQSFNYSTTDIRMDVTSIVNAWITNTIPNEGFIVKKAAINESGVEIFNSLKFFSRDTNTIYPPKLEVAWDDSVFVTGSLKALSDIWNGIVYFTNNQVNYSQNSKAQLRVASRAKYPVRTYETQSNLLVVNHLPSSSFYAIKALDSEDYIIPFSDYTKISCDGVSNYFNLWMDGLQPERYYRFLIKIETGSLVNIVDNDFIFKVIR